MLKSSSHDSQTCPKDGLTILMFVFRTICHHIISCLIISRHISCYHILWHDFISDHMISYLMIWYDMMSYDIIWCDMMSYDVIWYHMMSYDIIFQECMWTTTIFKNFYFENWHSKNYSKYMFLWNVSIAIRKMVESFSNLVSRPGLWSSNFLT